jgi:hypothetical protein
MEIPIPNFITDLLPAALKPYALVIVAGSMCTILLLAILLLAVIARFLFGGGKGKDVPQKNLEQDLSEYPELTRSSGDRQLRAEGVPVRMRLVVVAPAGTASDVDLDELDELLDQIVPGLGEIYAHDKPRVVEWPTQVSYKGFGNHFHRNMLTGAAEGEQTRWVLIAGRVKVGKKQIMLGLALQSIKPNTIARRTIDSHEWASILRVRVKGD